MVFIIYIEDLAIFIPIFKYILFFSHISTRRVLYYILWKGSLIVLICLAIFIPVYKYILFFSTNLQNNWWYYILWKGSFCCVDVLSNICTNFKIFPTFSKVKTIIYIWWGSLITDLFFCPQLVNFFCLCSVNIFYGKGLCVNAAELLSLKQVIRELNTTRSRLNYAFESGRLKEEDFPRIDGRRFFRRSDFPKIKEALFYMEVRGWP